MGEPSRAGMDRVRQAMTRGGRSIARELAQAEAQGDRGTFNQRQECRKIGFHDARVHSRNADVRDANMPIGRRMSRKRRGVMQDNYYYQGRGGRPAGSRDSRQRASGRTSRRATRVEREATETYKRQKTELKRLQQNLRDLQQELKQERDPIRREGVREAIQELKQDINELKQEINEAREIVRAQAATRKARRAMR